MQPGKSHYKQDSNSLSVQIRLAQTAIKNIKPLRVWLWVRLCSKALASQTESIICILLNAGDLLFHTLLACACSTVISRFVKLSCRKLSQVTILCDAASRRQSLGRLCRTSWGMREAEILQYPSRSDSRCPWAGASILSLFISSDTTSVL